VLSTGTLMTTLTGFCVFTTGAFAGSIIAIFFLVALLEAFRRLQRAYDRRLVAQARAALQAPGLASGEDSKGNEIMCVT
jgi:uncharacterized membrane protein YdjX (TVP38/TMEM64 family)